MKDKCILPIKVPPPIIGGLHHAIPLSIILAYKKTLPWFYTNYIQLYFRPNAITNNAHKLDFAQRSAMPYPFLKKTIINPSVQPVDGKNLLDYILLWLNNGYYINIALPEWKVPGTRLYQTPFRGKHMQFIFGCDMSKEVLYFLNYNKRGEFSAIDVPMGECEEIFYSDESQELISRYYDAVQMHDFKGYHYYVVLNKFIESAVSDQYDTEILVRQLYDYINSTNSIKMYNYLFEHDNNGIYGINVYKELIHYLKYCHNNGLEVDFRSFHFLWEHKKIMQDRIRHFEEMHIIDPDDLLTGAVTIFEQNTAAIRAAIFKYNITRDGKIIDWCEDQLRFLYENESSYIQQLIDRIQKGNIRTAINY